MYARYSTVAVAVLALACTSDARGQDIAQQVRATRDGEVIISFAAKPGTCGDGRTFISAGRDDEGRETTYRRTARGFNINHGDHNWDYRRCDEGPVWVELGVADGRVVDIETFVGARPIS